MQGSKPVGYVDLELAQAWCELLGATEVALEDSFAALGGDADKAAHLASLIQDVLGVAVPAGELLERDTLESMVQRVREDQAFRRTPAVPSADPLSPARGRDQAPPLSFAQQRLWFMQEFDPDATVYHVPTVLHLRGPLDRTALRQALDGMVARHEILRTSFPAPGGRPYQQVAPHVELPLPTTDLSGHPDPVSEADRIAAADAAVPFDLAGGPLLRAHLLRLARDEFRLVVTFHHIVIDGWSLEIFHRELGALYSAVVTGEPSGLPEVPLQHADYALWQRERIQGEVLDGLVGHWRAVLGEDPAVLEVPTDRPRPRGRSFRGTTVTRAVAPELVSRIREFGRRERITPNMVTLAAFVALLGGWSRADQVTVGVPVAGRTRPELTELIGCLINMVPVRTELSGEPGFRELAARCRDALLDASAHQELPFDKLVETLVSRRNRDLSPVFRVIFSFLGQRHEPVFAGLHDCVLDLTGPQGTAKYDLSLYVEDRGDTFVLILEYDTDLYGPETPRALLAAYERTLEQAVREPELPVRHFASTGLDTSSH